MGSPASTLPPTNLGDALGAGKPANDFGSIIRKELPAAYAESKANAEAKKKAAEETASAISAGQEQLKSRAPPPPPRLPPPPEPQYRSPAEAWGSIGMGFAMLASAFTRRPMVNALNAGAQVISAMRQGDIQTAKEQFERWKAQSDYAVKLAQYEHDAYKDFRDGLKDDINLAIAKGQAVAIAHGDTQMKALLDVSHVEAALGLDDQRKEAARLAPLRGKAAEAGFKSEIEQYEDGVALKRARAEFTAAQQAGDPEAMAAAQQKIDVIGQRAKDRLVLEGKTPAASDQRLHDENALLERLKKEWLAKPENADKKEVPASVEAQLRSQAGGHSVTSASADKEYVITDADGKTVDKFLGQPSKTDPGLIMRRDNGQPIALKEGQTIHLAPPPGRGAQAQTAVNRLVGATTELVPQIRNLMNLPIDARIGSFMGLTNVAPDKLGEALKRSVLGNLTGEAATAVQQQFAGVQRNLAAIEAQGAASGLVGLTNANNVLIPQNGWSGTSVMRSYAEMRQIVEQNIRAMLANENVADSQKQLLRQLGDEIKDAVPFSVQDVNDIAFSKDKNKSVSAVADKILKRRGASAATGQPGAAAPTQTRAIPPQIDGKDTANDPDGTGYNGPGGIWVKRGNQIVLTPGAVAK